MKNILLILFFVTLICIIIRPQSIIESSKQEIDSIKLQNKESLNLKRNKPFIKESELNKTNLHINDSESVWLRTKLQLEYSVNNQDINNFNKLMLPLNKQYIESQKLNFVNYFLGITQTAAVGYLAYHHIKKYGFWK